MDTTTIAGMAAPVAPVRFKAMIIDDAFDEGINDTGVTVDDFRSFLEESEYKSEIERLLEENQIEIPDLHGVRPDSEEFMKLIDDVWSLRKENAEAQQYLNPLFHKKLGKIEDLQTICDNLKQHDFDVITKNSTENNFDEVKLEHYKIILLDYNLGPDGEEGIRNASNKAHDIYNLCDANKKPLMVLMSSYINAKSGVEDFRKRSNLGNVIFRFAPKENLKDNSTVSLLVELFKSESEQVHKLQKYITTLHKAATKAAKDFETDVSKLTIDDYTFIHQTTVDEQSHPFGDYLGWLYGAHWSNLLLSNSELKKQKDQLDSLMGGKPLPYYGIPSDTIAKIYMNALFEPETGDIPASHRLAGKILLKEKKTIAELPHLHLGDIFMKKGEANLFMVINPQCDLERPVDDMKEQSILLMPGDLYSLKDGRSSKSNKTELILVEDQRYQIIWKVMQVISIPLGDFNKWKKKKKLKRTFRLRLPFALEIQHEFTSKMARVGLPVSPPFSREVKIQVFIKNVGGGTELLLPDSRGMVDIETTLLVSGEYGFSADWPARNPDRRIRLTLDFAMDLKKALAKRKEELLANEQPELGEAGNPKLNDNDKKTIQKIDKCLEKFDEWFLTSPYFEAPTTDNKPYLIQDLMRGFLNYQEDNKDPGTLLLINVVKVSQTVLETSASDKAILKNKDEAQTTMKPKAKVNQKVQGEIVAKSKVKSKTISTPKKISKDRQQAKPEQKNKSKTIKSASKKGSGKKKK